MENIFFWIVGSMPYILPMGLAFSVEHFVTKSLERRGYKNPFFLRILLIIFIAIVILVAYFFVYVWIKTGGNMSSYLGDDPVSFIKHIFGY